MDISIEWTKLLGSNEWASANAITIGLDHSIYIAGETSGDLYAQTNKGGYRDAFISKFNSGGEQQWTKLLGSNEWDSANAITIGLDGSIYITGNTSGDLDGQTNSGNSDAFISKFNSDGEQQWTKLLGTFTRDYANALTIGGDGSIYITGDSSGDLDGQTNSRSSDGFTADAFITKFGSDG